MVTDDPKCDVGGPRHLPIPKSALRSSPEACSSRHKSVITSGGTKPGATGCTSVPHAVSRYLANSELVAALHISGSAHELYVRFLRVPIRSDGDILKDMLRL